ncbi:MAG: class B sortase [Eubacteriales bacterium]|nr:class B sortase [Eubacteriales bacterium]
MTAREKRTKTKYEKKNGLTREERPRRRPTARQRRTRRIRSLLLGIFLGLCICLLIFSVWKLASILLGYQSGEKEYKELRQYVLEEPESPDAVLDGMSGEEEDGGEASVPMTRIDLDSLKALNSDAVGWIEIPDTAISYPLVHTTDNTFYLTHTFLKETNRSGSIFIENLNSADFTDLHTIIYGHNMKNGSMFAGLKEYDTQSYFEAHPYVYVDLADGSHCYQIFSCHEAAETDITYTIGYQANDTYASFLESLKSASLYDTGVDVSTDDSVITLSTCTKNGESRFVVHAKKLY